MSRPKKPTNLKVLEGNPGKRPLPENEPKPAPKAPKRPSWLTGEGRKMWDRLAPKLEKVGLLTEVDGEAFAAACQSWKDYVDCQKVIKKHGRTYKYKNQGGFENETERPEVKAANKALEQFRSFCREFGLTPASRAKIEVQTDKENLDEMEDLLSK